MVVRRWFLACGLIAAGVDCDPGRFLSAGGGPKGPSQPVPLPELQADLRQQVRDLEAEFQRACGCAVAVRFDDHILQSRDKTREMTTVLGDLGMEFGFGCNNAPSKNTIYCKMTTLEVALVNEPAMITASFRSGVVTAMIDPHENFPVELVERAIGP